MAYRLDDGTALLSAWRTLPKGDGELEHPEDQLLAADERCYLRVVGTISQIRPTDIPSITVEGIQKVTDGYEILHHYMEAMVAASASQRRWPVCTLYLHMSLHMTDTVLYVISKVAGDGEACKSGGRYELRCRCVQRRTYTIELPVHRLAISCNPVFSHPIRSLLSRHAPHLPT